MDSNMKTTSPTKLATALLLSAFPAYANSQTSNCGTPLPSSPGNGFIAGQPISEEARLYWAKDALLYGFDWFQTLKAYFPMVLPQSGALAPNTQVVDMAYATQGVMRFDNVVIPDAPVSPNGIYQVTFRYAYQAGLFPGITDRPMSVSIDGGTPTTIHFPITGSFSKFCHSWINVPMLPGRHEIRLNAISDHGVARIDDMVVSVGHGLPPPTTAQLCNSNP
jgi:hypothetical protein